MGLECVVEGVETLEELAALEGLGATLVQGYIYAAPLREQDVREFLSGQAKAHDPVSLKWHGFSAPIFRLRCLPADVDPGKDRKQGSATSIMA